jgi:hypothetical protein
VFCCEIDLIKETVVDIVSEVTTIKNDTFRQVLLSSDKNLTGDKN